MNDIEKLLTLADKDSVTQTTANCNLGTCKLHFTINGVPMRAQYTSFLQGIFAFDFEFNPSPVDALARVLGKEFAE